MFTDRWASRSHVGLLLQITWTAKMVAIFGRLRPDGESGISYLPLSHVAAQLFDIYIPIVNGATLYFAQPDALKVRIIGPIQSRPSACRKFSSWEQSDIYSPSFIKIHIVLLLHSFFRVHTTIRFLYSKSNWNVTTRLYNSFFWTKNSVPYLFIVAFSRKGHRTSALCSSALCSWCFWNWMDFCLFSVDAELLLRNMNYGIVLPALYVIFNHWWCDIQYRYVRSI